MANIIICSSMFASKEIVRCSDWLISKGNTAVVPKNADKYTISEIIDKESVAHKIEHDLIKEHFEKIKDGDAILVINVEKDGIANYIGGNTFLEMGFAHVLGKKIFLLNPYPNARYKDELIAMQPIILNGNLELIK